MSEQSQEQYNNKLNFQGKSKAYKEDNNGHRNRNGEMDKSSSNNNSSNEY